MFRLAEEDANGLARLISLEQLKAAVLSMQGGKLPTFNGPLLVLTLILSSERYIPGTWILQ